VRPAGRTHLEVEVETIRRYLQSELQLQVNPDWMAQVGAKCLPIKPVISNIAEDHRKDCVLQLLSLDAWLDSPKSAYIGTSQQRARRVAPIAADQYMRTRGTATNQSIRARATARVTSMRPCVALGAGRYSRPISSSECAATHGHSPEVAPNVM
jgi:hypothetical protein